MKREDAEEFTQSLGQIVGGSWRQIHWAKKQGVPAALGLSVDDWVNKRLGGYVKLAVEDRRKAAEELAAQGESNRGIAGVLGVDKETVRRDLSGANAPNDAAEDESEPTANGANAPTAAQKAKDTRGANSDAMKVVMDRVAPCDCLGVNVGDFRELAIKISDDSVDLVFTDPPYDRESVALYEDAAKEAARILKPGGSFIAYGGQYLLPEILAGCAKHLRLWWINACVHGGQLARMTEYGVVVHWKPLVWFVKGTRSDKNTFVEDIVSGNRQKDFHPWQQHEAEAAYYIEKLTVSNGLVVDFFLGGGTTAVAAERLGRRWAGFEIDETHAASAIKRIAELRKQAA